METLSIVVAIAKWETEELMFWVKAYFSTKSLSTDLASAGTKANANVFKAIWKGNIPKY